MTANPLQPFLDNKNLSEKLYKALRWPPAIYNRVSFPFVISAITYSARVEDDGTPRCIIAVTLKFRDTGEEIALEDPATGFPSQELLAQMNVFAGPQAMARAQHRKDVEKRVEKERQRLIFSNKPW